MKNASQTANVKPAWALIFLTVVAATLAFGLYLAYKLGSFRFGSAEHIRVVGDIQLIKTQLAFYKTMTGFYPTTRQGLAALVTSPAISPVPSEWKKLLSDVPKDPWGNDYIYLCPGQAHPNAYDLYSPGLDHISNTRDDDWGK